MTTTTAQSEIVPKQSPVWGYFERINSDEHLKAKCLINGCGKVLSTPRHSTSTLIRHLRDVHKLNTFKLKEKLVNRSVTKKISSQLKKKLDHAGMVAIIEDGRSFNDFGKTGFQKFIYLILPNYTVPHRITISKNLKRLDTKQYLSMIDSLTKLSSICISTDFWSDSKGVSYLVLTGHFVSDEFDFNSTIIRFPTFQKRHFSDIVGVEIENQLIELKIYDKVISITCDAAPNMIKMFDFFSRTDITRVRCQAHLLHLIVCNGLNIWFEPKKNKHTTDEPNSIDPDEQLTHALKKVDIFDIQELSIDEDNSENNSEGVESQAEDEEDVDDQQHDGSGRNETEDNSSDNDSDSNSSYSEYDSENTYESYGDNFQEGVNVDLNENGNEEVLRPDPRINLVINKSRELIRTIRESSVLSLFVTKIKHQQNDDNIKNRSLMLDVRTRWNSTFKMLKILYTHRFVITELFQKKTDIGLTKKQYQHLNCLEFSSDCWYITKLIIKVLKPFYGATKAMSGSNYPSVGITFYVIRRIDKEFLSIVGAKDDPVLINMKKCLLDKMLYYNTIKDPLQTKTLMFYGYFDPFCVSYMTNNETNEVENQIKSIIRHQSSNNSTQASTASPLNMTSNTNVTSTTTKKKKKSLISYFVSTINGEDIQETQKQPTTIKMLNDEFKLYRRLAAQFIITATDCYETLTFWKQNKNVLPNLMPLAQKYLAVPGTSVKADSAFSISAYYGRKQRARLSADNLCFSVFLTDKL